jgi:hypothetical protein
MAFMSSMNIPINEEYDDFKERDTACSLVDVDDLLEICPQPQQICHR